MTKHSQHHHHHSPSASSASSPTSSSFPSSFSLPPGLTPRQIPTLAYTLHNLSISLGTILLATLSLWFTFFVVLPLSIVRGVLVPRAYLQLGGLKAAERGKVVLVLGASSGIGREVVRMYGGEDAVVVAASSNIDKLRESVIELGDTKATLQCVQLDLSAGRSKIVEAIKTIDKEYGPITHLYEVGGVEPTNHGKDHAWNLHASEEIINVNVSGTVAAVMTAYELMKHRGFGKICIVGSTTEATNSANMISYTSARSFIATFAQSLRVLGASSGVDVVAVQPGIIDTRIVPSAHLPEAAKRQFKQDSELKRDSGAAEHGFTTREIAFQIKEAVEKGGRGIVGGDVRAVVMKRGLNLICEEVVGVFGMRGPAGRK